MRKNAGKRARATGYRFERAVDESLYIISTSQATMFHMKLPDTHAYDTACKAITRAVKDMLWNLRNVNEALELNSGHANIGAVHKAIEYLSHFTLLKGAIMPKVPSDFLVLYRGMPLYIELKSTVQDRIDLEGTIKTHQHQFANQLTLYGGARYVFMFEDRRDKQNFSLVTLSRKEKCRAVQDYLHNHKQSHTWSELRAYSNEYAEVNKTHGGHYANVPWCPYPAYNVLPVILGEYEHWRDVNDRRDANETK